MIATWTLFAQETGGTPWTGIAAALTAAAVLGIFVAAIKCYKRCPSNMILVVWGARTGQRTAKTIQGGGELVVPIIQDYDYLSLKPIQIAVPLKGALSSENIRVNVPSVFTVMIGTELAVMQNAAMSLLRLTQDQISEQASDIIFGQLRQVIASMTIEEINRDRDKFLGNIQGSLEPELRKIGLVLINVNITDITDDAGYIEAIGRKAASAAIQQALIDVAEQEKRGAIGVSRAKQEKLVQVAEAEKLQEIGTKTAEKDRVVSVAELAKQQQIGVEIAKFEQQSGVKASERETRVKIADADALAIEGENLAKAKVAASNAELAVRQAESFQLGETKKREAQAAVNEAQYKAEARAAVALGEKMEAEKRAALESVAKAEKAKVLVDAEAEAERKRIDAEGQAKALFAQLDAEARGNYEVLAKKAQGLRELVSACGGSQEAFQLLMLEHIDRLSETAAKAISNIKFDKVVVWENGGANGQGATAGFLQSMGKALPPMLQIMQEIGGVKMPEYFGKMAGDAAPPRPNEGPAS